MASRLSHISALPATAWMDKTPELRLSGIFRRPQSYSEGRLMPIFDDKGFDAGWNDVPSWSDEIGLRNEEDKVRQQPDSPDEQVSASGVLADRHREANTPLYRTFAGTLNRDLLRRADLFEAEELLSGFNCC